MERSTIPTSAKLLQMYVTHFGKCDIRYGKCDISALFYHNNGYLSRDCGHFVLLLSREVRIILFPVFCQTTLRVCVYIYYCGHLFAVLSLGEIIQYAQFGCKISKFLKNYKIFVAFSVFCIC